MRELQLEVMPKKELLEVSGIVSAGKSVKKIYSNTSLSAMYGSPQLNPSKQVETLDTIKVDDGHKSNARR